MAFNTLRAIVLAAVAVSINGLALKKGVAVIHETSASGGATIRGTLVFTANGGNMEVTGQLTGLPDGIHGFHIHEFGDESTSTDKAGKPGNRYGSHFVPTCKPPDLGNCNPLTENCDGVKKDECALFGTHGLPPDPIRQAGDMGNLVVKNGKVELGRLKQGGLEIPDTIYGQDKMSLDDDLSSILGRAVAIHKFEDIGRDIPLYDGFCAQACKVPGASNNASPPGRSCGSKSGTAKLADIYVKGKDTAEPATFAALNVGDQVETRYPTVDKNVWYRAKITVKPAQPTGLFNLEVDTQNACARRISATYLLSAGALRSQMPDPYGAAGPAIAGGVVGRMNPNAATDGKTPTTDVDATKPPTGIIQISCFLRATTDAAKKVGGDALIIQKLGTNSVTMKAKLSHGTSMGGSYSFHFHDYGDLRPLVPPSGDKRRVGAIYKENTPSDIVSLKELKIAMNTAETRLVETFNLPAGVKGVDEYIGRSLTIHSGPTKETPTISYGVCGIASPLSTEQIDTTTALVYKPKITTVRDEDEANGVAALGLSFASFFASFLW